MTTLFFIYIATALFLYLAISIVAVYFTIPTIFVDTMDLCDVEDRLTFCLLWPFTLTAFIFSRLFILSLNGMLILAILFEKYPLAFLKKVDKMLFKLFRK